MGALAAPRAHRRGDRRSFRMALAGLLLSFVGLSLSISLMQWLQEYVHSGIQASLEGRIAAITDPGRSLDDRGAAFAAAGRPSAEELDQFAAEVARRYGAMNSMDRMNLAAESDWSGLASASATMRFERGSPMATMRLRLVSPQDFDVELLEFVLLDPSLGDLRLGAASKP